MSYAVSPALTHPNMFRFPNPFAGKETQKANLPTSKIGAVTLKPVVTQAKVVVTTRKQPATVAKVTQKPVTAARPQTTRRQTVPIVNTRANQQPTATKNGKLFGIFG